MRYDEIEAMNWSSLKLMDTSPLMYHWRQTHPRPDTPSFLLGRAIHCAILEPDQFDSRYIIRPEKLDGRTKAGKAWLADVPKDVETLPAAKGEVIKECTASVLRHPDFDILECTRREVTATWTDRSGVKCKGRLDAVGPRHFVDLKSCDDLGRFERDAAKFLYHGQLAWYLDGAIQSGLMTQESDEPPDELDEDERFTPMSQAYIVAVETSEPYDCGFFRVPEYAIECGRELYRRLLDLWISCRDADVWPGRFQVLTDLELPISSRDAEGDVW